MKDRLHYKPAGRSAATTMLGPLLLSAALMGTKPSEAQAQAGGYSFTPIAFLGGPAPGGGTFNNDFEPSAINSRGEMAFTADLIEPGQEGVFLARGGELSQVLRFGQPAPGGGTFSVAEMGNIGLNDEGDAAVGFTLEPFQFDPFVNGGIYRYSHLTQALTPVAVPGTPVPGGGAFLGADFDLCMNNRGTISFVGWVGQPDSPQLSVFVADRTGHIATVASSDTVGPSGGTFDRAANPRLNNADDVAFNGRESTVTALVQSVYVREAASGKIVMIANAGDPAPGGGVLVSTGRPLINDRGDVVFPGFMGNDPNVNPTGIYLHHRNALTRIAGPGDLMPGGGKVTLISAIDWAVGFNNRGEVGFATALDTGEEGLYTYSHGSIHLVARTGTVIPGVGTIFSLEMGNALAPGLPPLPSGYPTSGAQLNDRGQTFFGCTLTDGRGVLLLATPNEDKQ